MRRAAAVLVTLAILLGVLAFWGLACNGTPDPATKKTTTPGAKDPPKKDQGIEPKSPEGPTSAAAAADPCEPGAEKVVQGFPARTFDPNHPEKSDTVLEIFWTVDSTGLSRVLKIVSARFTWKDKDQKTVSITVVRHLELAEIYVPYDDGKLAYLDVTGQAFYPSKMRSE